MIENCRPTSPDRRSVQQPGGPAAGTRPEIFGREIYIERDDSWRSREEVLRCRPAAEVRLRYSSSSNAPRREGRGRTVIELRCLADLGSLDGDTASRRVRNSPLGVRHARVDAEVRLYDRLFTSEDPAEGGRDRWTT